MPVFDKASEFERVRDLVARRVVTFAVSKEAV